VSRQGGRGGEQPSQPPPGNRLASWCPHYGLPLPFVGPDSLRSGAINPPWPSEGNRGSARSGALPTAGNSGAGGPEGSAGHIRAAAKGTAGDAIPNLDSGFSRPPPMSPP